MDPTGLTNPEWTEIGELLTNLWMMVAAVIFLATNILIGHIFIPSLVATGQIPENAQRARPVFYVLALAAFAVGLFLLLQVIDLAGVLDRIWDDYWI